MVDNIEAERFVRNPLIAVRPVRDVDPQQGLFIDEEGNSYGWRVAVRLSPITLR
jgi:hypothetical protein